MTKFVIDTETLSTKSTAMVIQIGCIAFDDITGEVLDKFSKNINASEAEKYNLSLDASTVMFWLKASTEAQKSVTARGIALDRALFDLNDFINKNSTGEVSIYCHASFDAPIIQNLYKVTGISPAFKYYSFKDLRSICEVLDVRYWEEDFEIKRAGTHHSAVEDCVFESQYLMLALNKVRGFKSATIKQTQENAGT